MTYWTGLRQRLPAYGLAILILLVFGLMPDPPDEPYPLVIVHREVIESREPSVDRDLADMVANSTPEPERVATAPGGAAESVAEFCAGEVAKAVSAMAGSEIQPETPTASPQQVIQPKAPEVWVARSLSNNPGLFFRKDRLILTSFSSLGDLRQETYRVWPGYSFRSGEGPTLVRSPRFGWWRPAVEATVYVGLGYIMGRVF